MELYLQENLVQFRKRKGNTQEELANHLGVTVQTGGTYALPVLNRLSDSDNIGRTAVGNDSAWMLDELQNEAYAPYREDERMQKIVERLKRVAAE